MEHSQFVVHNLILLFYNNLEFGYHSKDQMAQKKSI